MTRPRSVRRSLVGLALLSWALAGLGGCRSYQNTIGASVQWYESGRFEQAAEALSHINPRRQDALLYHLERGKALQDAGQFTRSAAAFDKAERMIVRARQKAEIRIAQETLGTVFDQYARDYEPSYADAILASTYQAVNQLALGDLREARVYLRRAADRQTESLQEYEVETERGGLALDRGRRLAEDREFDAMRSYASQRYADFSNPFTTYLSALTHYLAGDQTNGAVALRKLSRMVPNQPFADRASMKRAEAAMRGDGQPQVFVIFETGMAPRREAVRLAYATSATGVSVLSLPTLRFDEPWAGRLKVQPGTGSSARTEPITTAGIASINRVIASEFQARLPTYIARTLISQVGKEAASVALTEALDEAGFILASLYKLATANVDDRTWRTLPAQIQVAQLDRLASGTLRLKLASRSPYGPGPYGRKLPAREVELPRVPVTFVLVRAVGGFMHVRVRGLEGR